MNFKVIVTLFTVSSFSFGLNPDSWSYSPDKANRCMKQSLTSELGEGETPLSLNECKLRNEEFALFWPRPRNLEIAKNAADRTVTPISWNKIVFANQNYYSSGLDGDWLARTIEDQKAWLLNKQPKGTKLQDYEYNMDIYIYITGTSRKPKITKHTDESYKLSLALEDKTIVANISGENYFGARHGIESIFQNIQYDDVKQSHVVLSDYSINDYPEFQHRGLSLDTSRSFVTKETLLRIIDGLAASKLNVLHWHIVDSQSFPVEMRGANVSQMTRYGAYDADKIYTQEDIKEIVEHANYRGLQVIPELDQPAHVGSGWNYPGGEEYTVCVNREPWYDYCVEPPCGQLNPGSDGMYDRLQDIYREWMTMFDFDTFHMGADEINFNCWNTSENVLDYMKEKGFARDEQGFIDLWSEFQARSSERLKMEGRDDLDIVVWTSHITLAKYIDNLDPNDYIVQIWTDGKDVKDPQISTLADKGYRMIFTNVDSTYLDCGYGAWVGEGNNWCSPYKGWQLQYSNDLYGLLELRNISLNKEIKDLVLGGETAMWTEQADDSSIEGKIFPRASAYAERLWTNPDSGWYEAETRMLTQRQRLVERGVRADQLQPDWCLHNPGQCYSKADYPYQKDPTTSQ